MSDDWTRDLDRHGNLLLVLSIPDAGDISEQNDPEYADMVADELVTIINEERRRNSDEAGRAGYYRPVMVNAIPGPQFLSSIGMRTLLRAIRAVAADTPKETDDECRENT